MGIRSDKINVLSLAGISASGNGNWFDLSSYRSGAFWAVTIAVTGSITPVFQMSPDNGTTIITPIPTGELAAPAAINATGGVRYPFIGNMNQAWVRVNYTIVTGPVSLNIFFIGQAD